MLQFLAHQKIPLKSIKLNKFGYKDDVLLLGDSAHSMTPFHAMGMITGLEDVRVFFEEFRDRHSSSDTEAFCPDGAVAAYTAHRLPDVNEMVDMADKHYHELRHGVRSRLSRARKTCDAVLSRWVPFLGWNSLYARIQFSHGRISVIRKLENRQQNIVWLVMSVCIFVTMKIIAAGLKGDRNNWALPLL